MSNGVIADFGYPGDHLIQPYFVSRCSVCFRHLGQNLFNSSRFGSFLLFFSDV